MGILECLSGTMKYLVFGFNLLFVLGGLAIIVLGIVIKVNLDVSLPQLEGINISTAPILLIIVGTITLVIAFLGCCGAWKENSCMLTSYAVILICLLVIQMAAGILTFVSFQKGTEFEQKIHGATKKLFDDYDKNQIAVDAIQKLFSCCGFDTKDQYKGNLPPSCCPPDKKDNCNESPNTAFPDTCRNLVSESIKLTLKIIGYIAIALCSTELLAIISSFYLSCSINKEQR